MIKVTKITKVIIGIPTYEAGISLVATLRSIYRQSEIAKVSQIIVVLDGKRIAEEVFAKIRHPKLRILDKKIRAGQSERINNIMAESVGETIILTNDDVVWGNDCLKSILREYEEKNADLVCGNVQPLAGKKIMERILKIASYISQRISRSWNNGDNYLMANGRLLLISNRLARKIKIPVNLWNNDAYTYLEAKHLGYKVAVALKAKCYFQAPTNLHEYINQSKKFNASQGENSRYFTEDISQYYHIPKQIALRAASEALIRKPIDFWVYLAVLLIAKSQHINIDKLKRPGYWDTDLSTKNLLNASTT